MSTKTETTTTTTATEPEQKKILWLNDDELMAVCKQARKKGKSFEDILEVLVAKDWTINGKAVGKASRLSAIWHSIDTLQEINDLF